MIIFGAILIAVGLSALMSLNIWPMLLLGLGTGLVVSGALGRSGFDAIPGRTGRTGRRKNRARPYRSAGQESS